jgi:hypothetical protein
MFLNNRRAHRINRRHDWRNVQQGKKPASALEVMNKIGAREPAQGNAAQAELRQAPGPNP